MNRSFCELINERQISSTQQTALVKYSTSFAYRRYLMLQSIVVGQKQRLQVLISVALTILTEGISFIYWSTDRGNVDN